jgi:hypothetical protein
MQRRRLSRRVAPKSLWGTISVALEREGDFSLTRRRDRASLRRDVQKALEKAMVMNDTATKALTTPAPLRRAGPSPRIRAQGDVMTIPRRTGRIVTSDDVLLPESSARRP